MADERNSDFFLSFGSNAGPWAKELQNQLAPANEAIRVFSNNLDTLDKHSADVEKRITSRLARIAEQTKAAGGGVPGADISGGGGGGEAGGQASAIMRDLATISSEFESVARQLTKIVTAMGTIPQSVRDANAKLNRSAKAYEQPRQGGSFSSAPGAVSQAQRDQLRSILQASTAATGVRGSNIASVGKTAIDEASINRVVSAIERGSTQQIQAIRQLGNRLIRRLGDPSRPPGGGGPPGPGSSASPTNVTATTKAAEQASSAIGGLRDQLEKLGVDVSKLTNEQIQQAAATVATSKATEQATQSARLEGETQAQARDRRRAAARSERDASARAERDTAWDRLNAAGAEGFGGQFQTSRPKIDPKTGQQIGFTRGRGALPKSELVQIADTFTSQGFDVPYSGKGAKNTTIEQLLVRIEQAYRRFTASGLTKDSLAVGGQRPDRIGADAQSLLGDLATQFQRTNSTMESQVEILKANALGGGDDTRLTDSAGRQRRVRALPGRGTAFGGDADELVATAERLMGVAGKAKREAATTDALRQSARADFDPFRRELGGQIEGGGAQAQTARRALSALRRATIEVDKIGQEAIRTADKMRKAGESEADIAKALGDAKRFDTPAYREGLQSRLASRGGPEGYDARAVTTPAASLERLLQATAIKSATAEKYGGLRNVLASEGAGRARELAANIPGVGVNQRGQLYRRDQTISPALITKLNGALTALTAAQRRESTLSPDASDQDRSKVRTRIENKAEEFANAVEQIAGFGPRLEDILGRAVPDRLKASEQRREDTRQRVLGPGLEDHPLIRTARSATVDPAVRAANIARTEAELAAETKRLSAARGRLTRAVNAETKAEQALESALNAEQKAAIAKAKADLESAQASANLIKESAVGSLSKTVQQLSEKANNFGDQRGERGEFLDPYKRDPLGYDSNLSYGKSVGRETEAAQKAEYERRLARVQEARDRVGALTSTGVDPAKRTAAEKAVRTQEERVKALNAQLGRLQDGFEGIADASEEVTKATKAEASEKRTAVQSARVTRRDVKELKGQLRDNPDDEGIKGALAAAQETYAAQRAARAARRAGGGGGVGGDGPPTTSGAADGGGGRNDILRQILARLNAIHTTLRQGVRTTSRGTGEGGGARAGVKVRPGAGDARAFELVATEVEKVNPALAELVRNDRSVATASKLVEAGILTQAQAMRLYGIELSNSTAKMKAFKTELANRVLGATAAAGSERAKETGTAQAERSADTANRNARRKQQSDERAAAASRALARTELETANASRAVSDASRVELARLKQLTDAKASDIEITKQQAKAYAQIASDLKKVGASASQTNAAAQSLLSGSGPSVSGSEVDDIRKSARNINGFGAVDEAMASGVPSGGIFGEQSAFTRAIFGNHGFWSRILNSTGTFLVRNFTAGFVFGLTNALQDVISEALLTESTFIRVSEALETTGRGVGNLRAQLQGISTEFGTSLNDVYEIAAQLTGLFDTTDEIAGATKIASQLQLISMGALSAQEAVGVLASTASSFGDELGGGVSGLEHMADVLTVIQDNLGVNIEVTAEGVARMSGLAQQLGLSFEQVAVYTGQIAKLTNQTGAAAGEQFSRILGAMQTGSGRAAINESFAATAAPQQLAQGDYGAALNTMIGSWDDLTEAQQRNVAVSLGGQRQAAAIQALFNDGEKILNTVAKAEYARGNADKRGAQIMQTLNQQIKVLQTNFQNLGNALVRTGILNFLGLTLILTNKILQVINTLLSGINHFTDQVGILGWIKDVGFGIIGLAIVVNLLRRSFAGVGAAIRQMPAVNSGVNAFRAGTGPATAGLSGGVARAGILESGDGRHRAIGGAFSQDVNNPAVRGLGRGLDRYITGPLQRSSSAIARWGGALEASRSRVVADAQARGIQTASERRSVAANSFFRNVGTRIANVGSSGGQYFGQTGSFLRGQGFSNDADVGSLSAQLNPGDPDRASIYRRRASAAAAFGSPGQARIFSGLARATDLANRGVGRVSSGLGTLAKSSLGADVALLGITAAIGLFIAGMQERQRAAEQLQEDTIASFGKNKGKSKEQVDQEEYVGPNYETARENAKRFQQNWFKTGMNALTSAASFQSVGSAGGRVEFDTQGYYEELAKTLDEVSGQGAEAIQAAQDATNDAIEGTQRNLTNADLSSQQKSNVQGELESIRKALAEKTEQLLLVSYGLDEADRLTSDQVNKINDVLGAFTAIGGGKSSLDAMGDSLQTMIDQLGLTDSSQIRQKIQALTQSTSSGETAEGIRDIQRDMLKAAEAGLQRAIGQGDAEQIDAQRSVVLGLMQQVATSTDAVIAGYTNTAMTISNYALTQGRYYASDRALQDARDQIAQEIPAPLPARPAKRGFRGADDLYHGGSSGFDPLSEEERARFEAADSQLAIQQTQGRIAQANRGLIRRQAGTRDPVTDARLNLQIARNTLTEVEAAFQAEGVTGATLEQLQQARQSYFDALFAQADAAHSRDMARQAAEASALWNDVDKASASEAQALDELAYQRQNAPGSEAYFNALSSYRQSQQATIQAQQAEAAAARETNIARINPGDGVRVAQARLAAAQAAQSDAAQFGTSSTQYQQATQQVIEAQRAVDEALNGVLNANFSLRVAIADAAGQTVKAARIQLSAANAQLEQALRASGGANSADVINARASVVSAEAGLRDARLQSQLDTIDFRLEMERLTADGAIQMLQNMLKTEDLTRQQRRDILLKIKGLRDSLREELTSSGFNITDNIKLPTAYEVRRSLGTEAYAKRFKASVGATKTAIDEAGGVVNQRYKSAQGGGEFLGRSGGGGDTSSAQAMREIRDAIRENGAQVNQDIDLTLQVSRPDMIEEIARRVVRLIHSETRKGARANSSRPRLVN